MLLILRLMLLLVVVRHHVRRAEGRNVRQLVKQVALEARDDNEHPQQHNYYQSNEKGLVVEGGLRYVGEVQRHVGYREQAAYDADHAPYDRAGLPEAATLLEHHALKGLLAATAKLVITPNILIFGSLQLLHIDLFKPDLLISINNLRVTGPPGTAIRINVPVVDLVKPLLLLPILHFNTLRLWRKICSAGIFVAAAAGSMRKVYFNQVVLCVHNYIFKYYKFKFLRKV